MRRDPSRLRVPGRAVGIRAPPWRRPGSSSSGRRRPRSRRSATSCMPGGSPATPAWRSSRAPSSRPGSTVRTKSPRSSPRPSRSASRCWSRRLPAAAGAGCDGWSRAAELPAALAAGSREAEDAFGDGAVYLEREIVPARHIEVQLLGDAGWPRGRHRRAGLLDPASPPEARRGGPGARPDGRTSDGRCTTSRSGSRLRAGLVNAATAEFLRAPDGSFYFLEVNTRLQVEHGVTELVSGLDIVREQFWLAAGRPLSAEAHGRGRAGRRAGRPRHRGPDRGRGPGSRVRPDTRAWSAAG